VRPSSVESRFEALRTTTTPLVDRDEEVDLLLRRWERTKRGDGCVVLISGEPGIGKPRPSALADWAPPEPGRDCGRLPLSPTTSEALPQTDEVYAEDGALTAIANDRWTPIEPAGTMP
jgi:hypothetical protein